MKLEDKGSELALLCRETQGSQHLGPAGLDLNVQPAWMQGVTGTGMVVSIVDDGKIS